MVVWVALCVPEAHAARLQVEADAPLWMHLGANVLLYLHIAGGALGLLSGSVAILARKGQPVHRSAGKVFFVSMFVSYFIGAAVAPFLDEGQRPNFIGGVLALYLLLTAWLAAKRPNPSVSWIEYVGLLVACLVFTAGLLFMYQGANHPSGTVDGSPPQAFVLFTVVGALAIVGDLRFILRKNCTGNDRVARHLIRMCLSFFIAAGSFFLGQEQMLPESMIGTWWQGLPVLFPVLAMLIYLAKAKFVARPA